MAYIVNECVEQQMAAVKDRADQEQRGNGTPPEEKVTLVEEFQSELG